jgi:YihY family inner membrane protein
MALVQRGANRIYGLERDHRWLRRYARAFLLTISAGTLLVAAFVLLAAGTAVREAFGAAGVSDQLAEVWFWARWPVGILLVAVAITVIFKLAPDRRQPGSSWMAFGTAVAVVLHVGFTALLSAYFHFSEQLGETYGPLLGLVALLLWTYLTALALLLGLAFAAQLEAVRAGVPRPRVDRIRNVPDTVVLPEPASDERSPSAQP